MKAEAYKVTQKPDSDVFLFFSKGAKGILPKVIAYQHLSDYVYNLAFGDLDIETGELNDLSLSNNGDMKKIIATVVQTLPIFFKKHPKVNVVFKGSNNLRTKLYQRIIRSYFDEFKEIYEIYGVEENEDFLSNFEIHKNYTEFSVLLKQQ